MCRKRVPDCRTKFQVEGVAPTNHSSSQKTKLNYLSHGIKIWTDLSSVLSQSTRLTDRQTDGQIDRILIARLRLDSKERGKNEKKKKKEKTKEKCKKRG